MFHETRLHRGYQLSSRAFQKKVFSLLRVLLQVVQLQVAGLLLQALLEQQPLAPDQLVLARDDGGGPSVPVCVLVDVEHYFLPGRLPAPGDGGPHVQGVSVGRDQGAKASHSEEGGQPVRDVDLLPHLAPRNIDMWTVHPADPPNSSF